jgi:hypothetical protein
VQLLEGRVAGGKTVSDDKMSVTRIRDESVSRIDPPLDPAWPVLKRLRWWAAIAEMDSGIAVDVYPSETYTKVGSRWLRDHGLYDYSTDTSSGGGLSESGMRCFLLGVSTGAQHVRLAQGVAS